MKKNRSLPFCVFVISQTTYARKWNLLESFHLRCLHRILGITIYGRGVRQSHQCRSVGTGWFPKHASPSLPAPLVLAESRAPWIEDGRITKSVMYLPALHFKDVCKRDLKPTGIDTDGWGLLADDRSSTNIRRTDVNTRSRGSRLKYLLHSPTSSVIPTSKEETVTKGSACWATDSGHCSQ